MYHDRVEFDEVYQDLREKLVEVFTDCGENCVVAYYTGRERDANDHEASNALQILEPLVSNDLRDELRDAYKVDSESLSLYSLREGEESLNDRYALVALRVATPLLQELFDDGMGLAVEREPYSFNPSYEKMLRELAVEEGQDPDRVIRDAGRIMRYLEPALKDLETQSHQLDSPDDTEE